MAIVRAGVQLSLEHQAFENSREDAGFGEFRKLRIWEY